MTDETPIRGRGRPRPALRVLAGTTAALWLAGIVLIVAGHDLSIPVLTAALVVGLAYCLLVVWRARRDPTGPSLLDFFWY
jgi:hypothetical protein